MLLSVGSKETTVASTRISARGYILSCNRNFITRHLLREPGLEQIRIPPILEEFFFVFISPIVSPFIRANAMMLFL